MSTHSPRLWAQLSVYRELARWADGYEDEDSTAHNILWAIQRLHDDETGELLDTGGLVPRVKEVLNPDMGAGLGDMGEWADWIIDTFCPERRPA